MAFDLKSLLGDKYKDDMTVEELLEAAKGINYVNPEDVVSKDDYAKVKDDYTKVKNANDSLSKEAKDWKQKYNSTLSEQEQKENEQNELLEQYQKRIAELERTNNVSKFTSELLSVGYSEKNAKLGAEALADGDMATFLGVQKKVLEAVRKDERATILKNTPDPDGGEDNPVMTKERLSKMSISELNAYYADHADEVESMLK